MGARTGVRPDDRTMEQESCNFRLGGSVGTGSKELKGEVLVVNSFDDLKARAKDAKGKIVLYNVPFTTYGKTVQYRYRGASEAAKVGAIASLVRSVGPYSMNTPHTGTSAYEKGVKKIPHLDDYP